MALRRSRGGEELMRAVISDGGSGAPAGAANPREFAKPLNAVAVPSGRFEEFFEGVVVTVVGARERENHIMSEMKIAETHRIGISERALCHFRSRPLTDSGD